MARRAQSLPRFGVLAGSPLTCEECIAFAQVKPCGTQVTLCARYVCIGGKHQSPRFASPLTRLECVIGGNLRRPALSSPLTHEECVGRLGERSQDH